MTPAGHDRDASGAQLAGTGPFAAATDALADAAAPAKGGDQA